MMTVHHTHEHPSSTTVVEPDESGPATALFVLIALVVIAALIWFIGFSGVVIDRGRSGPDINIRNQNPPAVNNQNNNPPPSVNPT
jgi:hypothetical protein